MGDDELYVTKELAGDLLSVVTQSMDGTMHLTNDRYTMKMSKGCDMTAFVCGENVKPIDHYLLDGDLFSLACKFWHDELYDLTFFEIPGLLEQWCDLSIRPREDVKRMLKGFLDDAVASVCAEIAHHDCDVKHIQ